MKLGQLSADEKRKKSYGVHELYIYISLTDFFNSNT